MGSTTLVVRFTQGRYGATPWGNRIGAGEVELPPSPWRLLRALFAVWTTRVPDIPEPIVRSLLHRLALPPVFFVPPFRTVLPRSDGAANSHSRRTVDATAIFAGNAELGIRWPGGLTADESAALSRLAAALPYLGRADSLCDAAIIDDWQPSRDHQICAPLDVGESVSSRAPAATRLAPELPLDVDALVVRPVDVVAGRAVFPPGTRLVGYQAPVPVHVPPGATAVRLRVLSGAAPIESAVALADRLRGATVCRLNEIRGHEHRHSSLAGRDSTGGRLTGHQHGHYLAVPCVDDGGLALGVWAPSGLDGDELAALGKVRVLFGAAGSRQLRLCVARTGPVEHVFPELVGPARHWSSVTPFASPRHEKGLWADFVRAEVRRELAVRDLPAPIDIQFLPGDPRVFVRARPSRSAREQRAELLQLVFAEPVPGPLVLGHLSHFGLGLFRPER